jgi:hypothetical protein
MAQTSMRETGLLPTTPDAGEQVRGAMRERRSEALNEAIKTVPVALAKAALDPRVAYQAGGEARRRIARGVGQIVGTESVDNPTGSRNLAQGVGRIALGAGETALNVLPAAGLLGATTKAGRIRPLVSTAMGGVGGATVGAAMADPGERTAGAVLGGTAGLVGGQLVQSVQARRALRQASRGLTKDPEMAAALKTVQDNIEFRGPATQFIDKAFGKGWAEAAARWPDRLIQKTAEGARAFRQFGERLETQKVMRPSESPASRLNEAYDSAFRVGQALGGRGIVSPTTFEIIGPSYRTVFAPTQGVPSATRDALAYVVARRMVGRGDEMALKMLEGNADKLAQYKTVVERGQNVPMFQQVETNLKAFTDGLAKYAVEAGMWTPEMAERVVNSDVLYIPFKRMMEGRKGTLAGGGQLGRTSAMPKAMTGGTAMLENPAEALADYASAIIRRSDAHRLTASLVEGVERLGAEGLAYLRKVPGTEVPRNQSVGKIAGELTRRGATPDEAMRVANELTDLSVPAFSRDNPYIWVLNKGQRQYYRVESPEWMEAMAAFGQQSMLPGLVSALMPLRRLLTTTSTGINAPFFMVTNPGRDIPDVIAKNPGAAQNLLRGFSDSVTELFQTNQFAERISRAGAGNASLWFVAQNPKAAQRLYAPVSRLQETAKLGRVAVSPLMGVEAAASKVERVPRFAAARAAFDAGYKQWEDVDDAIALAARAFNRGTVDFRVKPGSPVALFMNDVVPFFGASTKGLARSIDLWQENPGRALAQASATMTATALEYMYSKKTDREKFVDRMPQERARSLIFGGYKVPLQQEQSVIASLTRYALASLERDDPEAFAVLAISVANALPPFDVAALGIPWGLASNESFFGPIEPGQLQRLPKEERRFASTPVTYSALSRGMREAQEALGVKAPAVLSPRELEFVVREGGLGSFAPAVTAVTDPLARRVMGRAVPEQTERQSVLRAMSPSRGFTVRNVPSVTVGSEYYYRERERSQQEFARLRGMQQAVEQSDKSPEAIRNAVARAGGNEQDIRRVLLRYAPTESGAVNIFAQMDKLVDVLREAEKLIRQDERLDEKARTKAVDNARDVQNALYRAFRREYSSYLSSKQMQDPAAVLDAIKQSLASSLSGMNAQGRRDQ